MYEQNKGKSSDVLGSMSELDDICFFNSFFLQETLMKSLGIFKNCNRLWVGKQISPD